MADEDRENDATRLSIIAALQPTTTSQFYTEDLVLERSRKPSQLGFVLRTHGDVDSHIPHPRSEYLDIKKDKNISKVEFRRFLRDGIPPKDTVLVRWQGSLSPPRLMCTSKLLLVDRSLLVGDVVKKHAQSSVSGTVTSTTTQCALLHMNTRTGDDYMVLGGDSPTPDAESKLLLNIPGEELQLANKFAEGTLVVYDDWIGRVEFLEEEIALLLSNGTVVVVPLSEAIYTQPERDISVNDEVAAKKGVLRRGRWVFGSYSPNVQPKGRVVQVRAILVGVSWMFRHISSSAPQPPEELDVDILYSGALHVYDRTRAPPNTPSPSAVVTVNLAAPDITIGDCVRFKDIAGAAVKYDGSTSLPSGHSHGKLDFCPRTKTLGYDLNTFEVLSTRTEVTVLWQDMTISKHSAASLVPDLNVDNDEEVWPGEVVVTTAARSGDIPPWAFDPARVGVIQSVKSSDRMAQVRWWPNASVRYYKGLESAVDYDDPTGGLLPDATLGELSADVESISLYDVKVARGLQKRRGDFVVIKPEAVESDVSDSEEHPLNWFGEVMDLGLDGYVTVRLAALENVRDVYVSPEKLVLVYSSDFDDETDGFGDETSDEEEDGITPDAIEQFLNFRVGLRRGRNEDQTMDEEDGENDEWATESEGSINSDDLTDEEDDDGDTPMTDEQLSSVYNSPSTQPKSDDKKDTSDNPEAAQPHEPLNLSNHLNAPPTFDVLDSSPPESHHYFSSRQPQSRNVLRRITKEHSILGSSLPEGVFVRTWESRLDLLRILILGPLDTPYALGPFIFDIQLDEDYPTAPPAVHFHSWTHGSGPINPNLYEDGKVCLSLLGTWHTGERTENWDSDKSTVLQVLVSILGLVLVKEPYYNEAGYEVRVGSEETRISSMHYSERSYFLSQGFITHALKYPVDGMEDIIRWLYTSSQDGAPRLLRRAIDRAKGVVERSEGTHATSSARDGLHVISAGAVVKLRQQLKDMEACLQE